MPHSILILAGSPRKNGNSEILADAFSAGAREAGNAVRKIRLCELKLEHCRACDYCRSHAGQCILKDEMNVVYDALKAADVLVFATPIHFFTVSTLLKTAIDRLYNKPLRDALPIRQTVFLSVCADHGLETFQPAIDTYRAIDTYLGWQDCGVITVPDVAEKAAIAGNPALEQARELGKRFV